MMEPYTNEPEGHDCLTKTVWLTKFGGKVGVFFAIYDVILYTRTNTKFEMAQRFLRSSYPFALAGATFGTVACALTNVRKKDDHINFMIAGAASGTVLGIAWNSRQVSILTGAFGFIMGWFIKDSMLSKWSWNFDGKEVDYKSWFDNRLYTKYSNPPPVYSKYSLNSPREE